MGKYVARSDPVKYGTYQGEADDVLGCCLVLLISQSLRTAVSALFISLA